MGRESKILPALQQGWFHSFLLALLTVVNHSPVVLECWECLEGATAEGGFVTELLEACCGSLGVKSLGRLKL